MVQLSVEQAQILIAEVTRIIYEEVDDDSCENEESLQETLSILGEAIGATISQYVFH